jgi:DNA-binding response OmpR family regulator
VKALVVDDDRVLADLVAFTLRREQFEVVLAYDGEMAWQRWQESRPDLIVLDVNLPKMDGFELCRRIRAQADTPILLLTVRQHEDDIVRGLRLGADDYIIKPFSPRQLVARAEAVLRRAGRPLTPAVRQSGDLVLDPGRREVRVGDSEAITLTQLETRLLEYLILNAGLALTSQALIDHVWGPDGADRDMLRQLVRRLRRKIEADPAAPERIETITGVGYSLVGQPD